MKRGLDEIEALEAVFGVATVLAEQGALPDFPEDGEDMRAKAEWVVAAADIDFFDVVVDALTEG